MPERVTLQPPPSMDDAARRIEAVIFTAPRPVGRDDLMSSCGLDDEGLTAALSALQREYEGQRHGVELVEIAGGHAFRVTPACEEVVRRFAGARRPDDLSPALLESLAVVAYLQPTTRAEVAQVRGVSSEWALTALVERGLIEEGGRAETPGAAILYRTTDRFLELFGLRRLDDLPELAEFALTVTETDELRSRLLANAERRRP